nr:EOG090X07PL [Sida crystallina]
MGDQSHQTILMELHVDPSTSAAPLTDIALPIVDLLGKHLRNCTEVYRSTQAACTTLIVELGSDSEPCGGPSIVTLRIKSSGLILLNIDLSSEDAKLVDSEVVLIFLGSHERILEYDVETVVADVQSEFQRIQILKTLNFGNLLVLDDLQNLAESDLIYTETLMQRGKIDYTGKDVLILGAGDGALLWELLKEKPKMVTMIEIDETVIKLCRQHLRSACGSALDNYNGPNHQIIIGDCLVELDRIATSGDKFDFIFADLTDIPLSSEPQNKEWQFLSSVLSKSLGLLRPAGQFLTHGSGISSVQSLALFESHLKNLKEPGTSSTTDRYVVSLWQHWRFYCISKAVQSSIKRT